MSRVEPARIGVLQPLHAPHQVRFRRLKQEVIMVAHQHPSVNAPASHDARLAQRFEEQLPVLIAPENRFAPIPPRHDVIEGTGILNANAAWHTASLLRNPYALKIWCLTPIFYLAPLYL